MTDTTEIIDLKSLLVEEKTVDLPFPGIEEWVITVAHVSREKLNNERLKCIKKKVNPRTRAMEDTLDEDAFLKSYIGMVIRDWSGLKLKHLKELLVVDLSGKDEEAEVPFSVGNAELLMKNSTSFDEWVSESVTDIQNFT